MQDIQNAQLRASAELVMQANNGRFVIAGYGSLPNRQAPGTSQLGAAWIKHTRKEMCIRVTRCRGKPGAPGLVAGIVPEANMSSMALLSVFHGPSLDAFLDELAQRELQGLAYDPRPVLCRRLDGSDQLALAFVAAPWHPDFVQLPARETADIIQSASGSCGHNRDYLDLVTDFERDVFGEVSPGVRQVSSLVDQVELSHAC